MKSVKSTKKKGELSQSSRLGITLSWRQTLRRTGEDKGRKRGRYAQRRSNTGLRRKYKRTKEGVLGEETVSDRNVGREPSGSAPGLRRSTSTSYLTFPTLTSTARGRTDVAGPSISSTPTLPTWHLLTQLLDESQSSRNPSLTYRT